MIPVNEPKISSKASEYLKECVETNWVGSEGPFVRRFENSFSSFTKRKHAIAVSNGSTALELAVAALGIGPGDEVIMPTFTIISCATAIVRNGATPVLVDSDLDTWNMNVEQVADKITSRTKAIMVVHIYGLPVDMDPILKLAQQYGIYIIEDAAEMLGQTYKGIPCGSFGDISTFSFYPNKLVTTGEGGMVATNDDQLAERCRSLRNLCFEPNRRFVHREMGWNMRMSNLQAALGLAQLEEAPTYTRRKREIGHLYNQLLAESTALSLPLEKTNYAINIYWVYGLLVTDASTKEMQELMELLGNHKIGTRPFFWPMHEQPVFRKMGLFDNEHYPNAELMARKGFYLPSGLAITDQQIEEVANRLLSLLA